MWGAGAAVVLGSVNGALINELHGGWPWWAGAAAGTAIAAWLAVRLAGGSAPSGGSTITVGVNHGAVGEFHGPVTFDQRGAKGVQIGDHNTQHNAFD